MKPKNIQDIMKMIDEMGFYEETDFQIGYIQALEDIKEKKIKQIILSFWQAIRLEKSKSEDIVQLGVCQQITEEGKRHYQREYGKQEGRNKAISEQEERVSKFFEEK